MSPAILEHSSPVKHHSSTAYRPNVYNNPLNEQETFNFTSPTTSSTIMNKQLAYKAPVAPHASSARDERLIPVHDFLSSYSANPQMSKTDRERMHHPTKSYKDENRSVDLSLESFVDGPIDKQANYTAAATNNEEKGLCIKCGTQLYQIKTQKKGIFHSKTKEVKIPLSIPGQVERGHCLQCGVSTTVSASLDQRNGNRSPSQLSNASDEDKGIPNSCRTSVSLSRTDHPSMANYQGSLNVYGERDGQGVMKWENGDVYTGEFFNGNRHGHGTLVFHDGTEYVGEWECNLQHGVGTRRWNNGDCYTGQYHNGKRTGEGRFYYSNGDMYIGQWVSGVMHGTGRYYYASGQRFEGIFINGKRQGKGKLQRTDGSLDVGVYVNDVRRGIGVRWSADRVTAWKMYDGTIKKKITVPEAVAMDYDIDTAAQDALNINTAPPCAL